MSASDHDAVVRSSFEKQAAIFGGDHSPFARRPHSPLAWLEPLEPDMIVLDVACGAGHVAEQVAPNVRQVVGIDLTPSLLELGAQRLREGGIANVLLQEGNAAELPFLDASFDLVVCRGALHHFPRPEGPVAEMARVCRPEGRVVVGDMVVTSADVRERFDELHRSLDPSHARTLLEAELAALLRSTVGPISYGETSDPFKIPIDHILSDAADRDAVTSALQAELAGGDATGFDPVADGGQILVSFTSTVVHATRGPA
ncbi:MAG TPA: methyltransferase domain-containing protein [Acidimicrobiia bacterium]|nr:methyltransferase domain-containing protein [Acidimicrobiia bacterium]